MDVDQLRAFVHTARSGSFSAAARQLGLAQPTLSRQIRELEREVGHTMIDRERRPVGLTSAGERFLAFAEATVSGLDSTMRHIGGSGTEIEGPIVVAASTTPGEFIVPALLARFTERHPKVRPSLLVTDSAGAAAELLAHTADVGFLGKAITNPDVMLVSIGEDEIVLAVPSGHRLAGREVVPLSELSRESLVEREGGSGTFESLRRLLERQGLRIPEHRVAMVAGTVQAQLAAVEAGVGLGFVSSFALANRAPRGMDAARIEGAELRRILYLAYVQASLSATAEAFVRFVEESTAQIRGKGEG